MHYSEFRILKIYGNKIENAIIIELMVGTKIGLNMTVRVRMGA